jgi:hypothetical protein
MTFQVFRDVEVWVGLCALGCYKCFRETYGVRLQGRRDVIFTYERNTRLNFPILNIIRIYFEMMDVTCISINIGLYLIASNILSCDVL